MYIVHMIGKWYSLNYYRGNDKKIKSYYRENDKRVLQTQNLHLSHANIYQENDWRKL